MCTRTSDVISREELLMVASRIGLISVITTYGLCLPSELCLEDDDRSPPSTSGFPRRRRLRRGSRGGVRKQRHIPSIVSIREPKRSHCSTGRRALVKVEVRHHLEPSLRQDSQSTSPSINVINVNSLAKPHALEQLTP